MAEEIFDVVVLGGGAGGVPTAVRAAQLGGKVAVVEQDNVGGLCMNRGCIPFGHMMTASNIIGSLSLGRDMGINLSGISTDHETLLKRQDELIAFMRQGVGGTLKKNGVEIIKGKGRIAGKGKIDVNGKTISCRNIILATGGEWTKPDFPNSDLDDVVSSNYLLGAKNLPKRVLLFGGSPWLIEIAQFLHRFGSQVIMATKDKSLLSNESKTITSRLRKSLKEGGIEIKTQGEIINAAKMKDGLHVDLSSKDGSEKVVVDKIITIERRAALKDIGLENVNLNKEGEYIKINDKMETGATGIYAIGDVTENQSRHYSHLASEKGIIAAENAMGNNSTINPMTFTRILFTQPEVACVGLTAKEAKSAGYDVYVGTAPLAMNPYGMILSENEGIIEIVTEKQYGEILGVHFIGTSASEMAGQAVLAIQMEMTVDELTKTSFPHPTLSESLAEAARDALGRPIYLP